MKEIRLDKCLADMGKGTRTEVKKYIKHGLVSVDGVIATRPEQKVDPEKSSIAFRGKPLNYVEYEYYMFHKPTGCVSAREDNVSPTVMSYIKSARDDLSPVGRLDKDTEGLLLITNDGKLAHALLSPSRHVTKRYEAVIEGRVSEQDVQKFAEGLHIGDEKPTKPAKLYILEAGTQSRIRLDITEGRFHQVKRMFEAVDKKVIYLKRLKMGSLTLDESLEPGACRALTREEVQALKAQEE